MLLAALLAFASAQPLSPGGAPTQENGLAAEPSRATAVAMVETCRAPTEAERDRAELALRVLQSFPRQDEIFEAALGRFGYGDGEAVCLTEESKQRLAAATLAAGAWDYGLAGSVRLAVAHQLGGRDAKIIEDVARVAFYDGPIADGFSSDIRPEARSVLASFGGAAAPWRDRAMELMNARDSLGTSAAQVAAASGDPGAIAAVARLLREALRREPGKAIPRERARQLVELAYALGAARGAARLYVALLTELLARDVESFAPPFGVIERPPSELCRALRRIGGEEAERALRSPRCKPPWFLLPS